MEPSYTDQQFDAASSSSTASWTVVGGVWSKPGARYATIIVKNTGSNGAAYLIEGSVDGTDWFTVKASTNIASGATDAVSITDYWPKLRVSMKPQTNGQANTVRAYGAATS